MCLYFYFLDNFASYDFVLYLVASETFFKLSAIFGIACDLFLITMAGVNYLIFIVYIYLYYVHMCINGTVLLFRIYRTMHIYFLNVIKLKVCWG